MELVRTPSPEFLADVIAFEAALIAISMPLSFEIISRISERYRSDVITSQFLLHARVPAMLRDLVLCAVAAVVVRFFVGASASGTVWTISALAILAYFLVSVCYIANFFLQLLRHATRPLDLVHDMLDEAAEALE